MTATDNHEDLQALGRCKEHFERIHEELDKAIIGQRAVVDQVLIALLAGGHALLEGVPGLAKTLLVSSLAKTLDLSFRRIQFTPDLMPSDVTGTDVLQEDPVTRQREYRFIPGPIFANLVLADEINRTPPKTQAAMLEAMQELQISAGTTTHQLPRPFFVLATQNPLEQEGTYPLPEAQLDRFLLHIHVDYPTGAEEWEIARRVTSGDAAELEPRMPADELPILQKLAKKVPIADQVLGYAWALVRSSRPGSDEAFDFVNEWVNWGAGPRGVLTLVSCAKARAVLNGRPHASIGDVQAVALPALRHRIATNYAAQANQIDAEQVIQKMMDNLPPDREYKAE